MTEEKKTLTPEDPVDAETLAQFAQLQGARHRMADALLQLELDKVEILRSVTRIDEQHRRLFDTILVDRGIPLGNETEIDAETGKLILRNPPKEPEVVHSEDPAPKAG